ncbi:VanZ family protein [Caenimonas sedimenti]|uniref:VanZ family protein n=1 Tax=Caenimonas sedimenti TaxID=2596921 RepID=A0A562ZVS4_9BURK|nr:VanZ family protein [Caenimonas sedimenti]TWO72284.1 VanZ family protein [Caenimonas sedimenti]
MNRYLALALLIAALLAGTAMPGDLKAEIEGQLWQTIPWSATAHFVLFALIALCPVYGRGAWTVMRIFALALLLAMVTELLQSLIPGRHPLVRDVFIDLSGTCIGVLLRTVMQSSPSKGA